MKAVSRDKSCSLRGSLCVVSTVAVLAGIIAGCSGGGGGGDASPLANPDTYPTGTGQLSLSIPSPGVLSNDGGSNITAELVSGPSSAQSFTLNPNGSFTYVHSSTSAATTDSFTYRAKNGTASSAPATVTINIVPPVAAADAYIVTSSGSISAGAPGVLSNDTGTGMTAEVGTGPQHATSFTLNADGSFTYVHDGSSTPDSFTYRTKVGALYSNAVTVTININQPPVATNGCYTIQNDIPPTITSLQVDLTQRVSDPNGNGTVAYYVIESLPASGSITGCSSTPCTQSNGILTYVPNSNSTGRRGMDKFFFHAVDSGGLSSPTRTAWVLNNGKVRIMPVGDSITAGVYSGDTPASADRVGYRLQLYNLLTALSDGKYGIQFVGSQSDGANLFAETHHEGRPGWCATTPCGSFSGIDGNISTWLTNNPVDIVLLHIGTNDLDIPRTSTTGVANILNAIDSWEGNNYPVSVFLAKIIKDVPAYLTDLDWNTYNTNIHTLVTQRPTDRLIEVDMQDGAGLLYGNGAPGADMGDNLHPNQQGYDKMAEKWKTDMVNAGVLPSCQ